MKKQNLLQLFAFLILAISFVACSNDDDNTAAPDDEEEEITRVELTLTSVDGSEVYKKGIDTNGNVLIKLKANTNYSAALEFYNEDEDVTIEINEESDDHLICFTPSTSNLIIERTDLDSNNKEIGLSSNWTTSQVGSGTVRIVLKHQPDLKESQDENCNIGGTDVDITFSYIVE